MLVELEPGVHPPGRAQHGGEGRPDAERRRAAVLQVRVQDVGRVDEQVGPHVRRRVPQFGEVLLELRLGVLPGEVGVGLLEPDHGEGVHHGRFGERLGQEDDVRVGAVDVVDQPVPEGERLGVRVVHAEDPHPVVHPVVDDASDLGVDALRVVVEVQRVDVLVLLRRVLRVLDRAVRAGGEPLGVLADPRVVGRGLEREVQRDLQAQRVRPGDEVVEVVDRPQVRVHGVVAAGRAADRPRDAGVVRAGRERVVRALAVRGADGVDGRQVDHVEAHLREGRQPLCGGLEGPGRPGAVRVAVRALRAREELVPAADQRALPLHPQRVRPVRGDKVPQWVLGEDLRDVRRERRG